MPDNEINDMNDFDDELQEKYQEIEGDAEDKGKKSNNNSFRSCLLVTGAHGVGKSISVNIILKEKGYEISTLDFTNLKGMNDVKEAVQQKVTCLNVLNYINNEKKLKSAIVIDEIESITASTEKSALIALQKLNEIHMFCPIIFISNNQHNKLLSETKKNSFVVPFYKPNDVDLKKILRNICNKENINIRIEKVIDKIILHCQSDIRRLIYTLQDIRYAYGSVLITLDLIDEYCEMSKKKDTDIDLYTATDKLLYEYKNINDCLRLYETEKVLLPLMIHQNYVNSILINITDEDTKFELVNKIAEHLAIGDNIENYIYGEQNWAMQEIHGFHTCVAPSFYLHKEFDNLTDQVFKMATEFTLDLNKTSIKKINKKNITNTNICFNDMTIFDYIYINKIIRQLIDNNKIDECVGLFNNYNIKLEHIESLLKIDKIKNTKTSLTSKQKKEFAKYIEN